MQHSREEGRGGKGGMELNKQSPLLRHPIIAVELQPASHFADHMLGSIGARNETHRKHETSQR